MQIKATLRPGQNGAKRYAAQSGDQLICVRYRYDRQRHKRVTTVELAVDEQDWLPGTFVPKDELVLVRVGYGETELRERIKEAGGFWDRDKKLWRISFRKAAQLGLEKRSVDGEFDFQVYRCRYLIGICRNWISRCAYYFLYIEMRPNSSSQEKERYRGC